MKTKDREKEKFSNIRLTQENYKKILVLKHQYSLQRKEDLTFCDIVGILLDKYEAEAHDNYQMFARTQPILTL